MSKTHVAQLIPLTSLHQVRRISFRLTLAAFSLSAFVVSTSAQTATEIAMEQGFTIPPGVQTAIVLRTQPDASCDLHEAGVIDPANTMRLYANGEGYIQFHVTPKEESDGWVQLDCTVAGKSISYPVHLAAGSSPTLDMPAPQTSVPFPQGSKIRPALTASESQQLSDEELTRLGYPLRPDAAAEPDRYATWLARVSRPMTVLPPHSVSRSDISHQRRSVEAGGEALANWSGYELRGSKHSYTGVEGQWNVPYIQRGESGIATYSCMWVGLDGDGTSDLVQAGTEQNYYEDGPWVFTSYYAWTEVVPNQPTEQEVQLLSPGDEMYFQATVNLTGGFGDFTIIDFTQGTEIVTTTPLGGTYFNGSEAEWIMERPLVGGTLPDLAFYLIATMTQAYAFPAKGSWIPSSTSGAIQITMYNGYYNNHPDNDELSLAVAPSPAILNFFWINFH